jgi:hypothetical protein
MTAVAAPPILSTVGLPEFVEKLHQVAAVEIKPEFGRRELSKIREKPRAFRVTM